MRVLEMLLGLEMIHPWSDLWSVWVVFEIAVDQTRLVCSGVVGSEVRGIVEVRMRGPSRSAEL